MATEFTATEMEPVPICPACGSPERSLCHDDLEDITFGNVAGRFTMMDCTACRALYLDPRPVPEAIVRAYARYHTHAAPQAVGSRPRSLAGRLRHMLANDYRAVRYGARTGPRWPLGHLLLTALPRQRAVLDAHYRHLPGTPGRVLDFGCGNGAFLRLARDELGWRVRGLDLDPDAVARARAQGLAVDRGGPEALESLCGQFEAATLCHVLEHVHDPSRLLTAIFARLVPGGVLFVETPNATAQCHRIFGRFWRGLEAPRHLTIPSWSGLELLLRRTGFVGLTRHPRADTLDPIYRRSAALRSGQGSEDPGVLALPGAPPALHRRLARDPDLSEYVTITARRPE